MNKLLDVAEYMHLVRRSARSAARVIARASTASKNAALLEIAATIEKREAHILEENAADVRDAKKADLTPALIDRLTLTPKSVAAMAEGLRQIAQLPDPVGELTGMSARPSGIRVGKMRVPLGVIGIIYESRPNVTADAAALCLRAGNAAILRGGSEAIESNRAIHAAMIEGINAAGLPANAIQLVPTTDRAAVGAMLRAAGLIDLIDHGAPAQRLLKQFYELHPTCSDPRPGCPSCRIAVIEVCRHLSAEFATQMRKSPG